MIQETSKSVLTWRPGSRRLRTRIGLVIVLLVVIGAGLFAAYMAPSHPESREGPTSVDFVEWIWSGGLTEDSIVIKARLTLDSEEVFLYASTSDEPMRGIRFGPQVSKKRENRRVVTFELTGLEPDRTYRYAIEAEGEIDLNRSGSFRTPASGPFSFTFAAASCATTGSSGQVFDAIRRQEPLFFIHMGDLHYQNIDRNDPSLFRDAYTAVLMSPSQSALHRTTPFVYIWDDHDYGPNDSDRNSASREAAQQVYREWVPSHTLVAGAETGPIYRAFTVGRVRFIVTDERSEKSPKTDPDTAEKTMLGHEQKEWLKSELLAASDRFPLIVWVQPVPWIVEPAAGADNWGGYTAERREIADFIAENQIEGLLMISGDAHMLAIDDGTHSDFSEIGGASFPVLQAAPLDRPGNVKGGPYSEGTSSESGQFGMVTVEDRGTSIQVTISGHNYMDEELMRFTYSVGEDADD